MCWRENEPFIFYALFGEGSYSVSVALHVGSVHSIKNYEWKDLALVFNVINFDKPSSTGVAWLPVVVECKLERRL